MNYTLHLAFFPLHTLAAFFLSERRSQAYNFWKDQPQLLSYLMPAVAILKFCKRKKKKMQDFP